MLSRIFAAVCLFAFVGGVRAEGLPSTMYNDPVLTVPKVITVFSHGHPDQVPLWQEALSQPDTEMKCRSAQAIAASHRKGMPGLKIVVPNLLREFERDAQPPMVTLAVAEALIALDAKEAGTKFVERLSTASTDLRDLVEPALANWKEPKALPIWQERLKQSPDRRSATNAIRGLLQLGDASSIPRLREWAMANDVPISIRLEAARAVAVLRPNGFEADAKLLASDVTARGMSNRLVAVSLLRQHSGPDTIALLQTLAKDAEPGVAVVALLRLNELDTAVMVPLIDATLANRDAAVRLQGVVALDRNLTLENIRKLADRLNDVHMDVRTQARIALEVAFTKNEWKQAVRSDATRILALNDWRGLEQASRLMAKIDHKPATTRLIAILKHPRPEAFVTAAWSLQMLAVPETYAPCFDHFESQYAILQLTYSKMNGKTIQAYDEQLSFLAQLLGKGRYRPADKMFQSLIPPNPPNLIEIRAGAVWALGLIHEGTKTPGFEGLLIGRVNAVMPADVEPDNLRYAAAISLGRLKTDAAIPTLRRFCPVTKPSSHIVYNACGWSITQITGEKMLPGEIEQKNILSQFLYPLKKQ